LLRKIFLKNELKFTIIDNDKIKVRVKHVKKIDVVFTGIAVGCSVG
jgi:hypothetical protein